MDAKKTSYAKNMCRQCDLKILYNVMQTNKNKD